MQGIVIGQPDAGSQKTTIRIAPRWVSVPQNKPAQPPPRKCRDWVRGKRRTPAAVKSLVNTSQGKFKKRTQDALEREFQRQQERRRREQARLILQS